MMFNRFALSFVFLGAICAIFAQETTVSSLTSEVVPEAPPQNDQAEEKAGTTMVPTRIPSPQSMPSSTVETAVPPVIHNVVNATMVPQAAKNEKTNNQSAAGIFTSSVGLLLTLLVFKTVL